jgi:Glycine zipper
LNRVLIPFLCLVILGCETRAGNGAIFGAAGGALIGGVAGGGTGALIGAGAGAIGGAIIGAALDSADKDKLDDETRNRYDQGMPLTVDDVIKMHKAEIEEDKIIGAISGNGTYNLTSSDVVKLQKGGVTPKVIKAMSENSIYER